MISNEEIANKKFIMIGGSDRSGTTLLNLIVANDPKAMALGEIMNLFYPRYKHHQRLKKKLEKDPIWSKVLKGGAKNLYKNLIQYFPDVDYFIDSSKNPSWFRTKANENPELNIKNILVFKHPEDQKKSLLKRNENCNWKRIILNYYRRYFFTFPNFRSVSLASLFQNDDVLVQLCKYLEIPYSDKKMEYWNKEHPNFFGSDTIQKKFIDKSGLTKMYSTKDIQNIEEPIYSTYEYMLDRAIWLNELKQESYEISFWKKYYLDLRNMLSFFRTRLQFWLKISA